MTQSAQNIFPSRLKPPPSTTQMSSFITTITTSSLPVQRQPPPSTWLNHSKLAVSRLMVSVFKLTSSSAQPPANPLSPQPSKPSRLSMSKWHTLNSISVSAVSHQPPPGSPNKELTTLTPSMLASALMAAWVSPSGISQTSIPGSLPRLAVKVMRASGSLTTLSTPPTTMLSLLSHLRPALNLLHQRPSLAPQLLLPLK